MSVPYTWCYGVKGNLERDRSSLDGSVPQSFDFGVAGQWTSSLSSTVQPMLMQDGSYGAIPLNGTTVLSKNSYVSIHDMVLDVSVPTSASGGCWLHVAIYVGDSNGTSFDLYNNYFNINVGQSFHVDVRDFENIFVPVGKNLMFLVNPHGTNNLNFNVTCNIVVDDN